jgi:hypothetical protein
MTAVPKLVFPTITNENPALRRVFASLFSRKTINGPYARAYIHRQATQLESQPTEELAWLSPFASTQEPNAALKL